MRRVVPMVAVAVLLTAATPAAAHIDVLPATVTRGEAVEFVVRVPTERDVPTTRVRLEIPSQVTVFSFAEPPAGWTLRPVRGADGRVSDVVYAGGEIPPERYAEFRMLGTPSGQGEALWPARQTYGDGIVKPWTGPPEGEGEARAESGPEDPGSAAQVAIVDDGASPAAAVAAAGDEGSGAAVWLGVIAIAIAGLAALGVGLLWSSRPTRLPGEEDPR